MIQHRTTKTKLSVLEDALIRRFANDLMDIVDRVKATTRGLAISVDVDEDDRNKAVVFVSVWRRSIAGSCPGHSSSAWRPALSLLDARSTRCPS